ncbi:hypothetical protein EDD18DRAFT_775155 [Armillaria luteobubalina]|uniref:Uncharacterized protein n=1 Tax=Armillaria luteobubalina TaxID=153913 RepID=A0AA39QD18_9AGAR|nr:hypothetical protein EDD18DRAFT_775155 [Armillaria luteobubalina]
MPGRTSKTDVLDVLISHPFSHLSFFLFVFVFSLPFFHSLASAWPQAFRAFSHFTARQFVAPHSFHYEVNYLWSSSGKRCCCSGSKWCSVHGSCNPNSGR